MSFSEWIKKMSHTHTKEYDSARLWRKSYHLQLYGWTSKKLCWVKKARQRSTATAWYYFCSGSFFLKSIYFGCAESSLLCRFFSSCGERGLLFIAVCRLLVVASLVAEHELWGMRASVVVAHWLSFPEACTIFPDQGLNLCLLQWQADSLSLSHQGSPINKLQFF